jgi:hypothetical protein
MIPSAVKRILRSCRCPSRLYYGSLSLLVAMGYTSTFFLWFGRLSDQCHKVKAESLVIISIGHRPMDDEWA